ncbi:MAG: acyl-CoA thioesterase [Gemmatimonadota bacterium]
MRSPFVIHEFVRWRDVDPAGIIRYDAYTRFMELGESELFRSLGISYRDFAGRLDFSIPRRALHLDFESPPTLDEKLQISVWISRIGNTSLTLNFEFRGPEDILRATGFMVLVCVARGSLKPRSWPGEFLSQIEPYHMTVDGARHGREAARQTI